MRVFYSSIEKKGKRPGKPSSLFAWGRDDEIPFAPESARGPIGARVKPRVRFERDANLMMGLASRDSDPPAPIRRYRSLIS